MAIITILSASANAIIAGFLYQESITDYSEFSYGEMFKQAGLAFLGGLIVGGLSILATFLVFALAFTALECMLCMMICGILGFLIDSMVDANFFGDNEIVNQILKYVSQGLYGAGITFGLFGIAGGGITYGGADDAAGAADDAASVLDDASQAAYIAADYIDDFSVSNKHLLDAGGTWQKFATNDKSVINNWIKDALNSPNAQFLPNNIDGSYRIVTDLGYTVGAKGETTIRVVIGADGKIWTAFPV